MGNVFMGACVCVCTCTQSVFTFGFHPKTEFRTVWIVLLVTVERFQNALMLLNGDGLRFGQITISFDYPWLIILIIKKWERRNVLNISSIATTTPLCHSIHFVFFYEPETFALVRIPFSISYCQCRRHCMIMRTCYNYHRRHLHQHHRAAGPPPTIDVCVHCVPVLMRASSFHHHHHRHHTDSLLFWSRLFFDLRQWHCCPRYQRSLHYYHTYCWRRRRWRHRSLIWLPWNRALRPYRCWSQQFQLLPNSNRRSSTVVWSLPVLGHFWSAHVYVDFSL